MVPAQPLSKRSRNFGTIPRRRRCLNGASNFGKEKSLDKAKARQAPSFHLSGWRGFYLRQNQIFRASSFRSDGPSWPDLFVPSRAETQQLAWSAASLGTATRTSARTRRRLAAARVGTPGRMRGSTRRFLLPHKSGFSGVAGLDAFVRFLLHLLVRLHLLARRRRLLSLCRQHGDGNASSGRHGEN